LLKDKNNTNLLNIQHIEDNLFIVIKFNIVNLQSKYRINQIKSLIKKKLTLYLY